MTSQSQLREILNNPLVVIALSVVANLLTPLVAALFRKGRLVMLLGISILGSSVIAVIAHFCGAGIVYSVSILFAGIICGVLLLTLAAGLHRLKITGVSSLIAAVAASRSFFSSSTDNSLSLQDFSALLRNPHTWDGFGTDEDLKHPPANPDAAKRLLDLNRRVRSLPMSLQLLIAYIADESTIQLLSPPGRQSGEDISTEKYLELLKLSLANDELCDVTFFETVSPYKWGDPDARDTELAKSAWRYFDIQERLKKESRDRIRMRRVLLMERDAWKGDSSDEKDPEVKQARRFKEKHDDASISLWIVPPSRLHNSARSVVQDMAMFYAKDGCAWLIWSDVDDRKVEVGLFHAGIFCPSNGLPHKYQSFLRQILDETHLSNQNPHPFLLASKLPCNDPPVEFLTSAGIV